LKLLFHSSCTDTARIEYKVLYEMYQSIEGEKNLCSEFNSDSYFSRTFISKALSTNVLIVGSPLVHVFWLILLCFIFRVRIVYVMWDYYPVRILNKPFGNQFKVFVQYITEFISSKIISTAIIPTTDFAFCTPSRKLIVIPFWPHDAVTKFFSPKLRKKSSVVKFVFSGQVNKTRGLEECVDKLIEVCDFDFIVKVASPSDCTDLITKHSCVEFVGHLCPMGLEELYADVDVGLVSLQPAMETPGFPSKTFDYVRAALPIIYFGPRLDAYENIISSHLGATILTKQTEPLKLDEIFARHSERNVIKFEEAVCFTESSKVALLKILRAFA
jgi:hypothetical protein